MKTKSFKAALTGLLAALALALSFLEGLLPPLPMTPPGAKLGLSNIVVMYAADCLGFPAAFFLALLKGGFAFLTRGFTAGVMSLSGGAASAVVMWLLLNKTGTSLSVIGVCGALTHNLAQLLAARFLTSGAVVFYLPALLLFGTAAGLLTGTVFRITLPLLRKTRRWLLPSAGEQPSKGEPSPSDGGPGR